MAKKKRKNTGLYEKTFTFNGKRYHVYGATLAEAEEKVMKKKIELKSGTYKKGKELTLDEYHERWLRGRYGTVKESTIRKQDFEYKAISQAVIDKAGNTFGSLKLTEIETENVRTLQRFLIERTRKSGLKYYNTNTINGCLALLKYILSCAIDEDILVKNPAKPIKALKRVEIEARETKHRALTKAETQAFLDVAIHSWYYDCYRFMLHSGVRVGEVGALKLSDIKKDRIEIRRTITKNDIGQLLIGKDTKTQKGQRDIPLTDELKEIIQHQKEMSAILNGTIISLDDTLFKSPEGGILNHTCINRDIARCCKNANVERFTAHCFRDTFATRCVESGMNPKTLQELLGHSDISVTMNVYAHVLPETKTAEMKMVKISN